MKPHVKEVLIGLLIGLAANMAGTYLYIFFFSKLSLESTLKSALEEGFMGSLIALGAILNLIAFFLLLKKNQIYRARGVVLATVLAALLILISKFF
ncbi:hypothetical protein QRD02_08840 [Aequorivita sp. SDUM287046]|uniref:Major facilitator superfamily (MFS) profile domain-containing protein n=1 Tax=Aequorivita aurantiaca TaxID=3053356 RepID=A0ABT8DGH2_9FLAO|nr:hypothetical protein [Aequorivita aurantiaca]MDN3724487.1 hypothetical protein [Aequorivita aurantiaca]